MTDNHLMFDCESSEKMMGEAYEDSGSTRLESLAKYQALNEEQETGNTRTDGPF